MPVRIAQISDTHLSEDFPDRTADLQKAVDAINQLPVQPDLVVHTGDIADHGQAGQYQIARPVLDQLKQPYYLLAGNRDDREQMRAAFGDNPSLAHDNPFVQFSIDTHDYRIVVLDTLCVGSSKGQLCEKRLTHFRQMLAEKPQQATVVMLHHAPFEASEIPDPFQFLDWGDVDKFCEIVRSNNQIKEIVCGHLHRSIEARIDHVPVSSISCMAGDLRRGDVSDEDRLKPMYRVLTLV